MAFYNQIFLVFAISLFLTTLPSKATFFFPRFQASPLSSSKSSSSSSSPYTETLPPKGYNVPKSQEPPPSKLYSPSSSSYKKPLPPKGYKIPKSQAPLLSPSKSSSSFSSSSAYKKTIEIPKRSTPVTSNGDVSIFINSVMEATMAKTEEFISTVIEQRLEDPETDIYATDCLETCKEVYQDAVDAMKKAEEDCKVKNYYKANVDISAMMTDIDTCNDCAISVYGDDSEFKEFDNWIHGVGSDCLEKIATHSK
ncbi:pectinesterase inhibitor 10-like [Capsicum chacoense]